MSNLKSNPDFISVEEAAESLSVCSKTIRNWIKSGKLPAYETGPKLIRISVLDLRAFCKPARQVNWQPVKSNRSTMTEAARKKYGHQLLLEMLGVDPGVGHGDCEECSNDLA